MAVYVRNPKCPTCNHELDVDDTYDLDYDDECLTLYQVGSCPICGKSYQWQRSATLVSWANTDLQEV